MQRAFFGNGAGFCLRSIAGHHIIDVRCDRRRHERAVFAALRVPSLAALSAKAWPMDAAPEAIHGISAAGDAAIFSLRAWRAARLGRGDLGELLFADHQHRVLDERRVYFANSISRKANGRAPTDARARAREWRLFHRREILILQNWFSPFGASTGLSSVVAGEH